MPYSLYELLQYFYVLIFCMMRKRISLLAGLFLISVFAQSQQVTVIQKHYTIDCAKKLILINQPVSLLNAQFSAPYSSISLDVVYQFEQPVNELHKGFPYVVKNPENEEFQLYFTELPVIKITAPNWIVDEPKVYASFILTEPDGGEVSHGMGIELRGGSSLYYPKSNYLIELWTDETGTATEEISLLGMHSEDDWNLQAMYIEPLRIRSKTANQLWLEMYDLYYSALEPDAVCGIHAEYTELFLNGNYRGIYAITERIDRKQLKIKKYDEEQGMRGELYKAPVWGEGNLFNSLEPFDNQSLTWSGFEFIYPEEVTDWNNLYNFVDFVVNSTDTEFWENYQQKFNLDNAVDYYIMLNLSMAIDNSGKNIYIARYNNDEPYFYVPYDLDGTFGIIWDGTAHGWTSGILTNGFYDRLICDCSEDGFNQRLKNRWNSMRNSWLTASHISGLFYSNFNLLYQNGVYMREEIALGQYYNYNEDAYDYLDGWISQRLDVLDTKFNLPCNPQSIHDPNSTEWFRVYPNPVSDKIGLWIAEEEQPISVQLVTTDGKTIFTRQPVSGFQTFDVIGLSPGLYLLILQTGEHQTVERIIVAP